VEPPPLAPAGRYWGYSRGNILEFKNAHIAQIAYLGPEVNQLPCGMVDRR